MSTRANTLCTAIHSHQPHSTRLNNATIGRKVSRVYIYIYCDTGHDYEVVLQKSEPLEFVALAHHNAASRSRERRATRLHTQSAASLSRAPSPSHARAHNDVGVRFQDRALPAHGGARGRRPARRRRMGNAPVRGAAADAQRVPAALRALRAELPVGGGVLVPVARDGAAPARPRARRGPLRALPAPLSTHRAVEPLPALSEAREALRREGARAGVSSTPRRCRRGRRLRPALG